MVFASAAANLIAQDTNQAADIFLYRSSSNSISRVSIHTRGTQANGGSFEPAIAAGGQVIVFTSLATNLTGPYQKTDTNAAADVFAYDRTTLTTQRVSVATDGSQAEGWSHQAAVSADGRFIVFSSNAANLDPNDTDASGDIFLFDRSEETTQLVSQLPSGEAENGEASHPGISADSRFIAFRYRAGNVESLYLYDRVEKQIQKIAGGDPSHPLTILAGPVLSAMGETINWLSQNNSSQSLNSFDQRSLKLTSQPTTSANILSDPVSAKGILPERAIQAATAYGANATVYALATNGTLQIFSQQTPIEEPRPAQVAGWVTDRTGRPLGGVRLRLSSNLSTTTDLDGAFRFEQVPAGTYNLQVEKKGFEFTPSSQQVRAGEGLLSSVGIEFSGLPAAVILEAARDIGMPYSLERGCPSPFEPCGGPYHGYFSGDCTDLVLDAYLSGVDLNIQIALELDALNQPRHYYRWRNARNAHDMWRYFTYSDQMLAPDQPYQPGDIVFFDWQKDGQVDHVAVISEVTARGTPKKMIDATGVIDENPSGLAVELDWKAYHSAQTPGHARWRGSSAQSTEKIPDSQLVMLFALDSTTARASVQDAQSRMVGGVDGIPGSQMLETPLGQVISVVQPASQPGTYLVEVTSDSTMDYQLGLQIIHEGAVQASESFRIPISAGATQWITVQALVENGKVRLNLPDLP